MQKIQQKLKIVQEFDVKVFYWMNKFQQAINIWFACLFVFYFYFFRLFCKYLQTISFSMLMYWFIDLHLGRYKELKVVQHLCFFCVALVDYFMIKCCSNTKQWWSYEQDCVIQWNEQKKMPKETEHSLQTIFEIVFHQIVITRKIGSYDSRIDQKKKKNTTNLLAKA